MKKHKKKFKNNKGNDRKINYNKNQNSQASNKEVKTVVTNVNKNIEVEKKENPIINIFNKKEENKKENQIKVERERVIIDSRNLKSNQNKKIIVKRNRSIIPYKINTFSSEVCSLCNKPIVNMSTSIFQKESQKYCHFECATAEIRKRFILKPNQRITYVGSGIFAIIEDVKVDGKFKFVIKERVNFGK